MANIDRAFYRDLFVDTVRTSGNTKNLGPTEIALVNLDNFKSGGYDALKDLKTVKSKDLLKFKFGNPNKVVSKWQSNHDLGTINFRKDDIIDLQVEVPNSTELKADIWSIGYNGTKGTGIKLNSDSTLTLAIELSGELIENAGYECGTVMLQEQLFAPRELPSEDNFVNHVEYATTLEKRTMHEIVLDAVQRLKDKPMLNGQKLSDFVDIKLITSVDNAPKATAGKVSVVRLIVPFGFHDQEELTAIQKQFPNSQVTYDPSKIVERAVCYKITVPGDGTDVKAFEYLRKVHTNLECDKCEDGTAEGCIESQEVKVTVTPEVISTHSIVKQTFKINLPDNECGESRLEELKEYYGSALEITETQESGLPCSKIYQAVVKGAPVNSTCEGFINDTDYEVSPLGFRDHEWKLVDTTEYKEDTEMGILIEGKTIMTGVDRPFDSDYPILVGFTKIKAWASDEKNARRYSEVNGTNQPQTITCIQRGSKPDGLGYEYLQTQVAAQHYWRGEVRKQGNVYYNGTFLFETPIKMFVPYVTYVLTIQKSNDKVFAQGIGEGMNIRFIVEKGNHTALEAFLNGIAKDLGLDEVKAYA